MKRCKLIKCWTDYPILEFGDISGQPAPVRHVTVLSYDGDKYVKVNVYHEGQYHVIEFKAGYLYRTAGRSGNVKNVNLTKIRRMINSYME